VNVRSEGQFPTLAEGSRQSPIHSGMNGLGGLSS